MSDKPERVLALEEAARLTNGDRNADYGPPLVNLSASAALKQTMRAHMFRDLSPAELEAIDMVLTKIGRIITGPKPKRDNYVDAAAYMAIAWEAAKSDMDEFEAVGRALDEMFEPKGSAWRFGGEDYEMTERTKQAYRNIWPDPVDDEKPSDT